MVLATEGHDTSLRGSSLTLTPYLVDAEVVAPLRSRVVELALSEARRTDLKRATRGIQTIRASIRYPHGQFGRRVPDLENRNWTSQFVDSIDRLGELTSVSGLDPVVALAIRRAISWHAEHSKTETKQAAIAVLNQMPDSESHRLAMYVRDGWGHLTDDLRNGDFRVATEHRTRRLSEFAVEFRTGRSTTEVVDLLLERIEAAEAARGETEPNPTPLIAELVKQDIAIGVELMRRLLSHTTQAHRRIAPVTLATLLSDPDSGAIDIAESMIEAGLEVEVARSLATMRGSRPDLLDGEADILTRLARHSREEVRSEVARGVGSLVANDLGTALEILAQIRFHDSLDLAAEIVGLFGRHGPIRWSDIPEKIQDSILDQLVKCPSIGDYRLTNGLEGISRAGGARAVVQLLLLRTEFSERCNGDRSFLPTPFDGIEIHFADLEQEIATLRLVRDWIGQDLATWQRPDLYFLVARGIDGPTISVLGEILQTGVQKDVETVSRILAKAPSSLVLTQVEFVSRFLGAAAGYGQDCLAAARAALHASAHSGMRTGAVGQPFSQDIQLRDTAADIADHLSSESVEGEFYRNLERSALESIRWTVHRSGTSDGREW